MHVKRFSTFSAVKAFAFLQLIELNTITTSIAACACVDFPQLAKANRAYSRFTLLIIIAKITALGHTHVVQDYKLFAPK